MDTQGIIAETMPDLNAELAKDLTAVQALEFEDASAYLQAASDLAERTASAGVSTSLHASTLSELGNAHRINGVFPAASQALGDAIAAAANQPDGPDRDSVLALAHLRQAIVCDLTGQIVAGIDHLEHASTHYSRSANADGLARCDMVRAALYLRIDEFEESERCYLRALEHYRESGQPERSGVVLANLSVLWRYMGRVDDAVAAGREAVSIAEGNHLRTMAIGNLAFALGDAGQLDEALKLARQTSQDVIELGDPNYVIEHWRAVATILMKMGEAAEARELLEAALAKAESLGYSRDTTDIHSLLSDACRDLGDFENAYRYHLRYHELVRAQSQKKAAGQLEIQKWRHELEHATLNAEKERQSRQSLAESLDELSDMHEQLSARAVELEWSSYRDSLTELANRRYFDLRLHDQTKRSREAGNDVAMILLDLDNFKGVNDRFGHLVGDEVLRVTAHILQSVTRQADLAARLGGEEFAVLPSTDLTPEALSTMAEKLREAFETHDWESVTPGRSVTVSIGIAKLSEAGHHPLRLLELADRRLYAAKNAGRNRVVASGGELDDD